MITARSADASVTRSDSAIAHEHSVYGGSEKSLDECSGVGISADEVTERTEHRAFTKYSALLEQACGGGRETDSLPFKAFQRIELCAQSRVQIFGANQLL